MLNTKGKTCFGGATNDSAIPEPVPGTPYTYPLNYPLVENGCIKCSSPRNDTDTDTDTVTETGFVCRWCDQDEAEKRAEELARSLG